MKRYVTSFALLATAASFAAHADLPPSASAFKSLSRTEIRAEIKQRCSDRENATKQLRCMEAEWNSAQRLEELTDKYPEVSDTCFQKDLVWGDYYELTRCIEKNGPAREAIENW